MQQSRNRGATTCSASSAAADTSDETDSFAALSTWVSERGGSVSESVGQTNAGVGGRGLVALRDIAEGELLMELPRACWLAPTERGITLLGSYDAESLKPLDTIDCALALSVAHEKSIGESSEWSPFLRHVGCPPHSGFPLLVSKGNVTALESPSLEAAVARNRLAAERLALNSPLEPDDVLAASQLVRTRRFRLNDQSMLLPVMDLLNHSFESNVEVIPPAAPNSETATWRLKSRKTIPKDQELLWQYCTDSNDLLLSTHGFSVANNPHDKVVVPTFQLRNILEAVAQSTEADEDFNAFRSKEVLRLLPDPGPERDGQGICLLERTPEGISWNPMWLDLCWLAQMDSKEEPHWSGGEGGGALFCEVVEWIAGGLFSDWPPPDMEQELVSSSLADRDDPSKVVAQYHLCQRQMVSEGVAALRSELA